MGVYDRDRTFNFITRNGNKDKIIDKKWLTLSGLLEETNNTIILPISRFPKVTKGYPKVAQGYLRLPKVAPGYSRLHEVP